MRNISEYKEEIEKMRWSFSRASSFKDCPYKFYLNYIEGEEDQIENFYSQLGKYVHEILEKILNGELSEDDAPDYYREHYEENVFCHVKESTMKKSYDACLKYFADVSFDFLKDYNIIGVEKECKFSLGGYDFIGYIDLLLEHKQDGHLEIWDHKSSAYPLKVSGGVLKSEEETFRKYKYQEYLYAYAVYQEYGRYPGSLNWNYFKAGKTVKIPFDQEEYEEALNWILNIIKEAEKEEIFPANTKDYMQCNVLCGFRHICDYKKLG